MTIISIGTDIEIRILTGSGYVWKPGRVTFADENQIVADVDGHGRIAVPARQHMHRLPQRIDRETR